MLHEIRQELRDSLSARLLPLLVTHAAELERGGINRHSQDSWRKRLRRRDALSFPSADALVTTAQVLDRSLDWLAGRDVPERLSDRTPVGDARAVLRDHVRTRLLDAVPWATEAQVDALLGTDPVALMDDLVGHLSARLQAEVSEEQRRTAARLSATRRRVHALLSTGMPARVNAATAPAVFSVAEWVVVERVRTALDGNGSVVLEATVPWDVLRAVEPVVRTLPPLNDPALHEALGVVIEISDAEVEAARVTLGCRGRGASSRAVRPERALRAFEELVARRGYAGVVHALRDLERDADGVMEDGVALQWLLQAFCEAVGLFWDGGRERFTIVPRGEGQFDGTLGFTVTEPGLMIHGGA